MEYDIKCDLIRRSLEHFDNKIQLKIFDMLRQEFGTEFKYISTNFNIIVKSTDLSDKIINRLYEVVNEVIKK